LAPFLDIKSVYDNIHCGILMDRLKSVAFSGNLLAFIFTLVSLRELEANYGWPDLKSWICSESKLILYCKDCGIKFQKISDRN
jgi:hypothetical protein